MENTNQPNTTSENNSSIKELMTILKDGEIKDSILSLKTFQGIEKGTDKETQTPLILLYGTKDEEPQQEDMAESILRHLDINLPSYLREATKKPAPVMKLSVPYTNLNDIFIDQVQNYLKANKLAVNAVKGDSDGKFIVMFSNKNIENKFLSDFIKDVEEYKGYTSMDAKNINVARSLTNTEIKQIVDMLNMKLPSISEEMMSNSTFQNTFKNILGKYTLQFSIDSFIKKDKNIISESAIKNFAKLQEDSQNLKVEPPFEKWTSGDVKEAPKQKKVSTLPVELEVKVVATPIEKQVDTKQEPTVKTIEESILSSLGITMPKHLREEREENELIPSSGSGLVPVSNNQIQKSPTEGNNQGGTKTSTNKDYIDANFREIGDNNQKGDDKKTTQNTNNGVLTLDSLKVLRNLFVMVAQSKSFSIRTKENSQLINGLPVVFGNGKDKYLKVSKDGISGLFTIQAALGEQSALTKMANWAYKNKNAFKSQQDTSSVSI